VGPAFLCVLAEGVAARSEPISTAAATATGVLLLATGTVGLTSRKVFLVRASGLGVTSCGVLGSAGTGWASSAELLVVTVTSVGRGVVLATTALFASCAATEGVLV
jgi:hypothetical protein